MLQNIDAVIFDMDGTIIDSMWMWRDIDIDYLKTHGIKMPEDLQKSVEGLSFTETAVYFKNRFNISDTVEKIKDDWNKMAWSKYETEVPLKEGVLDLLIFLKEKNIKMGIATSNYRKLTDLVLDKLKIRDFFDSARTSDEVPSGKPSPDIYLLVAKDLNVEPSRCLAFEDVVHGIMAGLNANMKVCAVYDEHSKNDDKQKKELADYYIHSMTEVLKREDIRENLQIRSWDKSETIFGTGE
ncbi:MAG TPA: HAD family phosphatase [Clostridiales bacterium]|nr:HAD family phosphatase [Clostridiales bacterium]